MQPTVIFDGAKKYMYLHSLRCNLMVDIAAVRRNILHLTRLYCLDSFVTRCVELALADASKIALHRRRVSLIPARMRFVCLLQKPTATLSMLLLAKSSKQTTT